MSGIVARIFLIIALFLRSYAIIAVDRKVLNSGSIFIVNFFFFFFFLGGGGKGMGARRNSANQVHACLSS